MTDATLATQAARALVKAYRELNEIRTRDGVPWTHEGIKASVTEEHFAAVVDEIDAAVVALTGRSAHCHPLLYEHADNLARVLRALELKRDIAEEEAPEKA